MKEKLISVFADFKEKLNKILADKKQRRIFITIASVLSVLLVTVIAFGIYVGDYYKADNEAISEFVEENICKIDSKYCLDADKRYTVYVPKKATYEPKNIEVGLIFYPGGKVDVHAYEPLMIELAGRGILCVLVEMPFNLAVFDVNAAGQLAGDLPHVENWYIGGHSLGGSMAASYLANNKDKINGLVLLGSYSTSDITDSRVLSVYGSEDGVMNREKYEQYKPNLPADFTESIIEGGNHAYFGMYGEQAGDGTASISPVEQIEITANAISKFIFN